MYIKDMFEKNILRPIKGVIKVGQTAEEDVYQELDEYVVTKEIIQHLSKFYENFSKVIAGSTDKMGVWISGFFGSGKSHFLKILSYLLENKEVRGKKPVEFFDEKIDDPLLLADMKKVGDLNTDVILFNIDSKSSVDGKSKEDAVLRVFTKVFYEHQGFYGDNIGVAQMEKYLSDEGAYETYKEEFKKIKGTDWVNRRRTFRFDADAVVEALTRSTDMSEETAREWFRNGVDNYEMSIENFAKEVKEYVDSKGDDYHLIFLADEMGQYIADDFKLILNLQTIAEDLGSHCKGKVWVMVTSQESIDSIVNVRGDDFSRIQGRFDTKLSLSSISVDEVIKKRILEKNEVAEDTLKLLYHDKQAVLKNIINFKDTRSDLLGYTDVDEFVDVYPFVPFQFILLQRVFEQIRKHGSSGKHLSEGERSMLSAFQETAIGYKDDSDGILIPFYAFYDTIEEFLNPTVSRVINRAAENPKLKDDEFNINLLKTLFMIKYIDELPENIDNIATLMLTHIDQDKLSLKEKITVSLDKLLRETLIQKNGDLYIFLTDDEQDINREIKNITPDPEIVMRELRSYVFDGSLYDIRKYRYSRYYDFNYNKKMDDRQQGIQSSHIGIHIISPLSPLYDKEESTLMMETSGTGEMVIKLGGKDSYIEEVEEALRIDEYINKKNLDSLPENMQNIINSKRAEERARRIRAKEALETALKEAKFFVGGQKIGITGSNVKEKINNGLKTLVESIYTKLPYIKINYDDPEDLREILHQDDSQMELKIPLEKTNDLAKKEIHDFIIMQSNMDKQIRVKPLLDRFSDKPYAWRDIDISSVIATLFKEQNIKLKLGGENLELGHPKLIDALTKPSEVDRTIITKRELADEELLRTARNICKDLWSITDVADDEDGLVEDLNNLIEKQISQINSFKPKYEDKKYPGLPLVEKGLEYFGELNEIDDNILLFKKLEELEEDLEYWKEDFTYVKGFFEGQKDIFDKGIKAMDRFNDNKEYLQDEEVLKDAEELQDILNHHLPYNRIKHIIELANNINSKIEEILEEKKLEVKEIINKDYKELISQGKQYGVKSEINEKVEKYYIVLEERLKTFNNIYRVNATIIQSQDYRKGIEKIIKKQIEEYEKSLKEDPEKGKGVKEPEPEQISINSLIAKKQLKTIYDVDDFVEELSKKLKDIINQNKIIDFID